jgi:hypothetical protein
MLEVVAHVVAAERPHGHGIPTKHTDLAGRRGGRFGRQRGPEKRAVLPVTRFEDERNATLPPRAKDDRVDRDTLRIFELG